MNLFYADGVCSCNNILPWTVVATQFLCQCQYFLCVATWKVKHIVKGDSLIKWIITSRCIFHFLKICAFENQRMRSYTHSYKCSPIPTPLIGVGTLFSVSATHLNARKSTAFAPLRWQETVPILVQSKGRTQFEIAVHKKTHSEHPLQDILWTFIFGFDTFSPHDYIFGGHIIQTAQPNYKTTVNQYNTAQSPWAPEWSLLSTARRWVVTKWS